MFNFDYNGGYTNEQLQYLDRMRRKQGQQWMQTGVIPGGLEEARRGGIEAPAPPQIRPMYANPQSSGMGPVAPEYTRAEQEAQAANQIFDGGGRRVPEYVFGAPEPVAGRNGEIAPMDKWADYNRAAAGKGADQGIFMQVGDGPAEFIPRKRNPQYDMARQRQQEELAARERAKQPEPRQINWADALMRGAQTANAMMSTRDAEEYSPELKAELRDMGVAALRQVMSQSPMGAGAAPQQGPDALPARYAQPAQAQPTPTPVPMRQRPTLDQLRGDGGQAPPPQPQQPPQVASGPSLEDGDEIIAQQGNSAVVRSADGNFYGIASNGTRRVLTEAEVQRVMARYSYGPR